MLAGILGALIRPICGFSGDLSGAGSTSTVTGTSQTARVPAGNSGNISYTVSDIGAGGSLERSINGGAFSGAGAAITVADGDTIQFRATGVASGDGIIVQLTDQDTSRPITVLSLTRT